MKLLSFLLFGLCLPLTIFSQTLEVEPFEQKLKETPKAILLDVRTSGEFGGGHLPKAKNMDFRSADFANQIKTLPKDQPIFVYCLSGGRSAQAAELLRRLSSNRIKRGLFKMDYQIKALGGSADRGT